MARKKRKSLIFTIIRMSVVPIAILGVVMTFYSQNSVREGMVFEIEKSLSGIAHNLISIYNVLDAGDFSQKDDRVYKGETEITSDYRVLDDIKNDTGADVTVFVGDERCLTTLVDKKGNRLVGSHIDKEVASQVIEDGQEYFSQNVDVMGVRYFGYYVPIRNDENEVVGVSFAGESAELKLLVDAVQASKFITQKQSRNLIEKLERFTSRHEANRLQRQVCVNDRVKTENLSSLYLIDDIHQAMHENQPVTFVYCEWNQNKELVPRHGGERYLVSPWMLMWEDENYYLLAYDHKAEMIKYFRVDKLRQLKREEGKREGETAYQKLDVTDFSKKTFGMFAGEKKRLQLVFDNSLIGVAIDRFGKEIPVLKESETQFRTFVEISVSKQFYGWLAGIGKGVSIVEPKEEQEKYRKYLENIWKL